MPSTESIRCFDLIAKVLLRCFIFGYLLLLVWFAFYLAAGDFMFRWHSQLFGLTQHEMALIHYCGMAFVKLCVLIFFLFPYIAIRLMLRNQRSN